MDKYGLIGYPLGHSFSRNYFNERFRNERIDAEYDNFEIPSIENFKEVLETTPNLRGLNVTIPYKEEVIRYLDELSPEARAIGAVNVIRVTHKGSKTVLKGFNSDVIGFTRSIESMLEPPHRKALILGTGGAAKAVDYGLKSLGLGTLSVARRALVSSPTTMLRPILSARTKLSLTVHLWACIRTSTVVRRCLMRQWIRIRYFTTCFTIPMKRSLCRKVASKGPSPRMD